MDIVIASYSITRFFYSIFLFYCTGEIAAGNKPGGLVPMLNGRQHRKLQPLEVGVSQSPRRLWKKIVRRSYISQYRAFPSFIFRYFSFNKDATYLFPTNTPWSQPLVHIAATAVPMSPTNTLAHLTLGMDKSLRWRIPSRRWNAGFFVWCCWQRLNRVGGILT